MHGALRSEAHGALYDDPVCHKVLIFSNIWYKNRVGITLLSVAVVATN